MTELDRIRDLDNEVFEEFQEYFPKIANSKFNISYPKTNLLLMMFDTGGTFIKNSIFDSCDADNIYGAKILLRSLIEHFVRFKYLFINWTKSNSDSFATEFLAMNDAREILDSLRSVVTEQQLYQPDFKFKEWDKFLKEHPKYQNQTKKNIDDASKAVTFNNLVRFLNNEFKGTDHNMAGFLGTLTAEYSKLSSFVHGGLRSYLEMTAFNSEQSRNDEHERLAGLSFQLSTSIKLFSLLMYYQTDKNEFKEHYLRVDELLKGINEKPAHNKG